MRNAILIASRSLQHVLTSRPYIPPLAPPFPSSSSSIRCPPPAPQRRAYTITGKTAGNYKGKAKVQEAPIWTHEESVLEAYPHLSPGQVRMLLSLRYGIETIPNLMPGRLFKWYDETLWQEHRQGLREHEESLESIALLMRFTYRRDDWKILNVLEERAKRWPRRRNSGTKWIRGWPPIRDVVQLCWTMKLTLASRGGWWKEVNRLLEGEGAKRLDEFGWNALLRYGLAHAIPPEKEKPNAKTIQSEEDQKVLPAGQKSRRKLRNAIIEPEPEEKVEVLEPLDPEKEDRLLAKNQAKSYIEQERNKAGLTWLPTLVRQQEPPIAQDANPLPPAWLFKSTLNQLADLGHSPKVIVFARRVLTEYSAPRQGRPLVFPVSQPGILLPRSNTLLNIILRSIAHDPRANFDTLLHAFHEFTGLNIEREIRKPSEEFKKAVASKAPPERTFDLQYNETSFLYLLNGIQAPLFRATWGFKLVQCAARNNVVLTTRTYCKLLRFCISAKKKGLALRVLQHCVEHVGNTANAKLKAQHQVVESKGSNSQLALSANSGAERLEWRICLYDLLRKEWITRPEMKRFYDIVR